MPITTRTFVSIRIYLDGSPIPHLARGYLEFGTPPFDAPTGYIIPVEVFRKVELNKYLYERLIERSEVIFYANGRDWQFNEIIKNRGLNTYDLFVRGSQPYSCLFIHI